MTDWQHEIRNQLNLVVYAASATREALAEGRTVDAQEALERIDEAVTQCVALLGAWDRQLHNAAPEARLPDQYGTGQAE
jgi:hypothetical protein